MLNIAFLFGTLSGLITVSGAILWIGFGGDLGTGGEVVGYLIMIVALSMIFFGVKRYRDQELGGVIKFVPAFMAGLAIAVVAAVIYVFVWELYDSATGRTFIGTYTSSLIEAERAKGVTGPALDAMIAEMEKLRVQYADPLFRIPMTFLEIFPVGLLIALISAAILRNPKVLPATA
jgi:hypothetical protein